MQNQQITEVESHKHLGIYFSNDCTWHHHIKYIVDKAWTRINIMRKLKFKLDRKSLEKNILHSLDLYLSMEMSFGTTVVSMRKMN